MVLRSFWGSCSNYWCCLNNRSNLGNNWCCLSNWSNLGNNWGSLSNNWSSLSNNWSSLCICYWSSLSHNRSCLSVCNRGSLCNWLCSSIVLIILSIWKISILNCRFHNLFFYCWRTVSLNNSWFNMINWVLWGWSNWKVGCSNFKSKGITEIVDSLNNSIGINIAIASSCNTISSLEFLFGRERIAVAIVKLSNVILGMILGICCIIRSSCN